MKKITVTIAAGAAAVVIAAAVFAATSFENQDVQAEALIEQPVDQVTFAKSYDSPEAFMAEGGGRAGLVMEAPTQQFEVSRGGSVAVPVVLNHVTGGDNPSSYVNAQISPPNGYIMYSPSLAKSTTEDQRYQAAQTGQLIPGSIDLGTLVTVDDANARAKVDQGKSHTALVTVSIPQSFPDEMVGESLEIPIVITATDDAGNPDTVFVENNAIEVVIVK